MSTTHVYHLEAYRGRRRSRVERSLALLAPDATRLRLGEHLAELLRVIRGDRGAILWSDEFGQLVPRPHVVVDLVSERPRRRFDARLLQRAWSLGIPGVCDVPELPRGAIQDLPRSSVCVALGSDGLRTWFMVVDSVAPRASLESDLREALLYTAGECAAVILHRDLPEPGGGASTDDEHFTGWSVLTDLDEHEEDGPRRTRVTERFLLLRLVRSLVDDELVPDPESWPQRIEDLRAELGEGEGLWDPVIAAAAAPDPQALARAVIDVGLDAEDRGELHGAVEAFRAGYWIAAHASDEGSAIDAARFLGRSLRRIGNWDDSERWYMTAADVAEVCDEPKLRALALDGQAGTLRARGNARGAFRVLIDALAEAERSGDPKALGSVHQHLMTHYHLEGSGEEAIHHGWTAVSTFSGTQDRCNALVALAGILLDLGAAALAEDAYEVALPRLKDSYFRAYALEGHAHAAALLGDRTTYEARYRRVEEEAWAIGGVSFQGQAYLYRGRAYEALGDRDEALEWFVCAADFARANGLNTFLFEADEAITRLKGGDARREPTPLLLPEGAIATVRGGLGALRRELDSVAS